jgi:hypothetical protein
VRPELGRGEEQEAEENRAPDAGYTAARAGCDAASAGVARRMGRRVRRATATAAP